MLIYATSQAFPSKTFVVSAKPSFTIARVRGLLMHILYDLGKQGHQFRLRFNGQYLKDSLTVEEYDLMDNAVLKMVPMANENSSFVDLSSVSSEESEPKGGALYSLNSALLRETQLLRRREQLSLNYQTMLTIHLIGVLCSVVSYYWYTGGYLLPAYIISSYFAPHYTQFTGFTGNHVIPYKIYCWLFAIFMVCISAASAVMAVFTWMSIVANGCPGWVFVGDCSYHHMYTAIFFSCHALIILVTSLLLLVLFDNLRFEVGDLIEKVLIQKRDLFKILQSAKRGRTDEKRNAAFELASLATASDDNKFMIVAESGLDTLISLSLSKDMATQEFAAEALAELLIVPSIQDKFVEIGGVRHLTALLHSRSTRCVQEATTAISYIVQDSDQNKLAVVADHGLDDLCRVPANSTVETQRTLAGLFLELIFSNEIREQIASMNTPAQKLIQLASSNDSETQRFALQSLELLAIESPEMICAQTDLLPVLLKIPFHTADERIQLVALKLLLYFAENKSVNSQLLSRANLYDSLHMYAQMSAPIIQKTVIKIIVCLSEQPHLRIEALAAHLDNILLELKNSATDREAWNMADIGLSLIQSSDELQSLPHLSTTDKISRMHDSQSSLRGSARGSITSLNAANKRRSRTPSAGSLRSIK